MKKLKLGQALHKKNEQSESPIGREAAEYVDVYVELQPHIVVPLRLTMREYWNAERRGVTQRDEIHELDLGESPKRRWWQFWGGNG